MSHFLQRLASGMTKPAAEPKLRPMVGSIYAPTGQIARSMTPRPIELAATERALRDEPSAAQTADAMRAPEPMLSGETAGFKASTVEAEVRRSISSRDRAEELPGMESGPRFEALLGAERTSKPSEMFALAPWDSSRSEEDRELGPAMGERDAAGRREMFGASDRTPLSPIQHPASIPAHPGPPQSIPLQDAIASLFDESPPRAAQTRPLQPPTQQISSALRSTAQEAARRAVQPQREPDEVYIHIGRIDVAAVSQPAAPAAPAPRARKSINLDEYLKRGNGRGR